MGYPVATKSINGKKRLISYAKNWRKNIPDNSSPCLSYMQSALFPRPAEHDADKHRLAPAHGGAIPDRGYPAVQFILPAAGRGKTTDNKDTPHLPYSGDYH